MKKMKNILKKFNIKSKGDITVQSAMNMLVMLMLITFVIEFGILGYKHSLAINSLDKMAKSIAVQSGVSNVSPPSYFSEFRSTYMTLSEFQTKLDNIMTNQIKASNYDLILTRKKPNGSVISSTSLVSGSSGINMEYGDFFDLKLSYNIELPLIKNIIPGFPDASGEVLTTSICEYKDYLK